MYVLAVLGTMLLAARWLRDDLDAGFADVGPVRRPRASSSATSTCRRAPDVTDPSRTVRNVSRCWSAPSERPYDWRCARRRSAPAEDDAAPRPAGPGGRASAGRGVRVLGRRPGAPVELPCGAPDRLGACPGRPRRPRRPPARRTDRPAHPRRAARRAPVPRPHPGGRRERGHPLLPRRTCARPRGADPGRGAAGGRRHPGGRRGVRAARRAVGDRSGGAGVLRLGAAVPPRERRHPRHRGRHRRGASRPHPRGRARPGRRGDRRRPARGARRWPVPVRRPRARPALARSRPVAGVAALLLPGALSGRRHRRRRPRGRRRHGGGAHPPRGRRAGRRARARPDPLPGAGRGHQRRRVDPRARRQCRPRLPGAAGDHRAGRRRVPRVGVPRRGRPDAPQRRARRLAPGDRGRRRGRHLHVPAVHRPRLPLVPDPRGAGARRRGGRRMGGHRHRRRRRGPRPPAARRARQGDERRGRRARAGGGADGAGRVGGAGVRRHLPGVPGRPACSPARARSPAAGR